MPSLSQVAQNNLVKFSPSNPENVALHLKQIYLALGDHNQAIVTLSGKMGGTSTSSASSAGTTIDGNITIINNGSSSFPGLGAVNDQTIVTPYIVQSTDNGALVLVGDTTPVSVTLDSALTTPYFVTLSNLGTANVTITPTSGTVNGIASLTLPGGSWVTVYFDGVNWQADSPGSSVGGVSQLIAGSNITLSPPGGVGNVTIAAATGSAPTITTNANGTAVAFVGGYVHQFGQAGPATTGVARTTIAVTFPIAFAGVPKVICNADNNPDAYGTAVFSCYPTSISTTGFTANLTCGVTIGGGGPANITNVVNVEWMADFA